MTFHLLHTDPIGEITNPDLKRAITSVKAARSKEGALERAFSLIVKRYKGYRFRTYMYFWKAFEHDPNKLWERRGFMHCTHQNFLLRTLLVKSGWFSEDEIGVGYTRVWHVSPHQYLKIRINGKTIAADPWNSRFGVPLGYYATGFGYKSLPQT